jgi:hypothetical protein
MGLPFTPDELKVHLAKLEHAIDLSRSSDEVMRRSRPSRPPVRWDEVEAFGTALFGSMLPSNLLQKYRTSVAVAQARGKGLRIQLRIQPPDIAALPWEFMFDAEDDSFVCLNPNTPVVRCPALDSEAAPLPIRSPLRVLGMMAAPCDLRELDIAGERRRIEMALAPLRTRQQVELSWVEGGSYRDLNQALLRGSWHVFHYIGHGGFEVNGGEGNGILAFEAIEGNCDPFTARSLSTDQRPPSQSISPDVLSQLLRGHQSLRLVVLNSCLGARASDADAFSSVAASLVRRGVPAVVAMQYEISDLAAVRFAQAFYDSLAAGRPVDRAVADGRFELRAARKDSLEWGTPVLLTRSSDGTLFSPRRLPEEQPGTPPGPDNRSLIHLVAGGAAVLLTVMSLLALWRMPGADVTLDARVTRVGVTLPAPRALGDPLEVTTLGVSGIASLELSRPVNGSRSLVTDAALLDAVQNGDAIGRLSLDLTTIFPTGTRLALAVSEEAGSYVLTAADSVPDLTVSAWGPIEVLAPQTVHQLVHFSNSGVISLRSESHVVRLEFRPAAGARSVLIEGLSADSLDLIRIDRYESGEETEIREVSAIRGGQLSIVGGMSRRLESGELLRLGGVRGEISRLELAGDHLRLVLKAHVDRLDSDAAGKRQSLIPSVLTWALAQHRWWVAGALTLYLILWLTLVARWLRSRNEAFRAVRRSG